VENPDAAGFCVQLRSDSYQCVFSFFNSAKSISQCFCIDNRCALPCDEEVPCVYGLCCFCTVCVDWTFVLSCCSTINQLVDQSRASKGLPPIQRNPGMMSTTTTTHYSNVNSAPAHATPAPVQYEQQHQNQYKQAPTSAPAQVVSANESYDNKI